MPRKLLLIEDDATFSRRLQANLKSRRVRGPGAETGQEAMRLLHSEYFDLVVTDIRLPDLDGLEICDASSRARRGSIPTCRSSSSRRFATSRRRRGDARRPPRTTSPRKARNPRSSCGSSTFSIRARSSTKTVICAISSSARTSSASSWAKARRCARSNRRSRASPGQDVPVLVTGETGVGKDWWLARCIARARALTVRSSTSTVARFPDENFSCRSFSVTNAARSLARSRSNARFELAKGARSSGRDRRDASGRAGRILKTIETLKSRA